MAKPDDELDPLVIDEPPRPTGAVVAEGRLQKAPTLAPAPPAEAEQQQADPFEPAAPRDKSTEVAQPDEGAPAPTRIAGPSPAVEKVASNPDAFTPQAVAEPRRFHRAYSDPDLEARNLAGEKEAALREQDALQRQEDARAKTVQKGLKDAGVQLETDPTTGQTSPRRDESGRILYKPEVIDPWHESPDGVAEIKRNIYGEQVAVPLKQRTDPNTGQKYVVSTDGTQRKELGPDEDFLMRKGMTLAGQQASLMRSQAADLAAQQKALKKQRDSILAGAVDIDPDDRSPAAAVKRKEIQDQRAQIDQRIAALDPQVRAAQDGHEAAQTEFLKQKAALIDRTRAKLGLPPLAAAAPSAPAQSPPEAVGATVAKVVADPIGFVERVKEIWADKEFAPYVGTGIEIKHLVDLGMAGKRLLDAQKAGQTGTPADAQLVAAYLQHANRPTTGWAKVASIVAQSAAFGGELGIASLAALATAPAAGAGGVAALGATVAEKGAAKAAKIGLDVLAERGARKFLTEQIGKILGPEALAKLTQRAAADFAEDETAKAAVKLGLGGTAAEIAAKSGGKLVQAAVLTPIASPLSIAAGTIRDTMPAKMSLDEAGKVSVMANDDRDGFVKAVGNNALSSYIENASEFSGGILKYIPVPKAVAALKAAILVKLKMAGKLSPFAAKIGSATSAVAKLAHWNGVLGEMAEEYIGGAMHAAVGQGTFKEQLPGVQTALDEGPKAALMKDLLPMAAAFAVPGTIAGASRATVNWLASMRKGQAVQDLTPDDEAAILKDLSDAGLTTDRMTPEGEATRLKMLTDERASVDGLVNDPTTPPDQKTTLISRRDEIDAELAKQPAPTNENTNAAGQPGQSVPTEEQTLPAGGQEKEKGQQGNAAVGQGSADGSGQADGNAVGSTNAANGGQGSGRILITRREAEKGGPEAIDAIMANYGVDRDAAVAMQAEGRKRLGISKELEPTSAQTPGAAGTSKPSAEGQTKPAAKGTRIAGPALLADGKIVAQGTVGQTHAQLKLEAAKQGVDATEAEHGFVDDKGNPLTRAEAAPIAQAAGQRRKGTTGPLQSEHLTNDPAEAGSRTEGTSGAETSGGKTSGNPADQQAAPPTQSGEQPPTAKGPTAEGGAGGETKPQGTPPTEQTTGGKEGSSAEAATGRADRQFRAHLAKGTQATLDALGVKIERTDRPTTLKASYREAGGEVSYVLEFNPDRADSLNGNATDEQASDRLQASLGEEVTHFAQFEAVRRAWQAVGRKVDGKPASFRDAMAAEYAGVLSAMMPDERAAAREAYGEVDGKAIDGPELAAEFVRQLLQRERVGTITEATMRAKPIIERILAVLDDLLKRIKTAPAALRAAYDQTKAVLYQIEHPESAYDRDRRIESEEHEARRAKERPAEEAAEKVLREKVGPMERPDAGKATPENAIYAAVLTFEGGAKRVMEAIQTGKTDAELKAFLSGAFGTQGQTGDVKILGNRDEPQLEILYGQHKGVIKSKDLVALARKVFGIGTPKGKSGTDKAKDETKPAAVETAKRSSTQLNLPSDTARLVTDFGATIKPEDLYHGEGEADSFGPDYGLESQPHVTALYGLDTQKATQVEKAVKDFGPVKATIGPATLFENADKPYDVLKFDIMGADVHRLNAKLKELPFSSDFPDYRPHMTVAYVKKGTGAAYVGQIPGLTGRPIEFSTLQFSNAEREKTDVPLVGPAAVRKPKAPEVKPAPKAVEPEKPTGKPAPKANLIDAPKISEQAARDLDDAFDGLAAAEPSEPTFYSQLVKTVANMPMATMTVAQARAAIAKGAKPDEIKASGILDDPLSPLAGRPDNARVTRYELTDYATERQTRVEDVVLGGNPSSAEDRIERERAFDAAIDLLARAGYGVIDDEGWRVMDEHDQPVDRSLLGGNLRDAFDTVSNGPDLEPPAAAPRFAQFQLPGAEPDSYREMFVTWPADAASKLDISTEREAAWKALKAMDDLGFESTAEANRAILSDPRFAEHWEIDADKLPILEAYRKAAYAKINSVNWQDGHSQYTDITNPVVRIRRNIREDREGRRVYFIEEMQGPGKAQQARMPDAVRKRIFEIGMKRAIRDAVDQGADAIGWTTGEQQAERYDLSKHIDEVSIRRLYSHAGWEVLASKGGEVLIDKVATSDAELENLVGKELAAKAQAEIKAGTKEIYSGVDLKVGGEGLKRLYDKTLPAMAAKLAERVGGRVAQSELPVEAGSHIKSVADDESGVWLVTMTNGREFKYDQGEYSLGAAKEAAIEESSDERAIHVMPLPDAWLEKAPSFALYSAEPITQAELPAEKLGAFVKAAQSLIASGIETPDGMARVLEAKFGGRFRKYSEALWDAFGMVKKSLRGNHDWPAVYAAIDQQAKQAEAPAAPPASGNVAHDVRDRLLAGENLDRRALTGMVPDGMTAKEADEQAELGIVLAARDIVAKRPGSDEDRFDALLDLYERQPNLTAKTSTSKVNQAYSTPVPLAYVGSRLAKIGKDHIVEEDTAGNGALLIEVPPENGLVNELNPDRAKALRAQGFTVTEQDATTIVHSRKADRLHTNPPFGTVKVEGENKTWPLEGTDLTTTQIDHAISLHSLANLKDDGRAVLIIGGTQAVDPTGRRQYYGQGERGEFFKALYGQYKVIDHFTVDGDLYRKQGAGWPVDVITIAGRGASPIQLPNVNPPRILRSWGELRNELSRTDEQRIQSGQYDEAKDRDELSGSISGIRDALTGGGRSSADAGNRPEPSGQSDQGTGSGGLRIDVGSEPGTDSAEEVLRPPAGPEGGVGDGSSGRPGDERRVESEADKTDELKPQFHKPYVPVATGKAFGIETPANLAEPQREALHAIERWVGMPLKEYVRTKLGYPAAKDISDHFAAEQTDALASAIYNVESGGGLILGDQTGIGKGRVVAGLMEYAKRNGMIPIFVTKGPTLYAAMLGDVHNIGRTVAPFYTNNDMAITNPVTGEDIRTRDVKPLLEQIERTGVLPAQFDAVFTTYDQIGKDKDPTESVESRRQAVAAGGAPRPGVRVRALLRLARGTGAPAASQAELRGRALVILDESHLGAGASAQGQRVRQLIENARVYYSSATFAKRPDAMPLYFKTNLRKAAPNADDLMAVFSSGGVVMQQITSQMLAKDGQYIRRERSFDGVPFETRINLETEERDRKLANEYTRGLRTLLDMSNRIKEATRSMNQIMARVGKRLSVPTIKMEAVDFASQIHNFVSQYLFAIKAEAAAQQAIEAIRQGHPTEDGSTKSHKVIVAVQNTMEGPITDMAARRMPLTFTSLLRRTLDGLRVIKTGGSERAGNATYLTIGREPAAQFRNSTQEDLIAALVRIETRTDTDGKVVQVGVVNPEVATEIFRRLANQQFLNAEEELQQLDLGEMPLSPIDYIRQRAEAQGIRTGEITGRTTGIDPDGKTYERDQKDISKKGQLATLAAFNNTNLDLMVINASGSTGISAHADQTFKNKAPRMMIVAQPHLDINEFMQTLGRIFRSGQVEKPRYQLLQTALPAEKRPAAILGKKMVSLNANTTSNADSEVSSGSKVVDIFNEYGDGVVWRYLADNPTFTRALQFEKIVDNSGNLRPIDDILADMEEDGRLARAVSSYAGLLPVEEQDRFWEDVINRYAAQISYLDQIGENKLRASAEDLGAETIQTEPLTPGIPGGDSAFDAPSQIETVKVRPKTPPMESSEVLKMAQEAESTRAKIVSDYRAQAATWSDAYLKQREEKSLSSWADQGPKERERLQSQYAEVFGQLQKLGKVVQVQTASGNQVGAVVGVDIDPDAPLTPSKQVFTVAVNTLKRIIKIPASQMGERISEMDPAEFEERYNGTREDKAMRQVATGNLVAASAALRGHGAVTMFTRADGSVETGILLPINFTLADINTQNVTSADQAEQLLRDGIEITADDGKVRLYMEDGKMKLVVPSSKAWGGKYWQDQRLTGAMVGGEMIQRGSVMIGEVNDLNRVAALFMNTFNKPLHYRPSEEGGHGPGLASPEPAEPAGETPKPSESSTSPNIPVLKAAMDRLPPTERKVLAMRVKGSSNDEIMTATGLTERGVETAYRMALGKMKLARDQAMSTRDALAKVEAEPSGSRTLGRPDLANPGRGERSRKMVDTVDQMRNQAGVPETKSDEVTNERAQTMWGELGQHGVEEMLMDKVKSRTLLNDEETIVAKRLVAQVATTAIRQKDDNAMLRAALVIDAYRETGTEWARSGRQRRDDYASPAERLRQFLGEALLTPPAKQRKRLEGAKDLTEKERILKEWIAKVEELKRKMAALGFDLDNLDDDQLTALLKDRARVRQVVSIIATAKADVWDQLYEYWVSSILSAPATNVANLVGNFGNAAWDFSFQRFAEASVNTAVRDPKAAHFGEFKWLAKGFAPGLARAWDMARQAWSSESPTFQEEVLGEPGSMKVQEGRTHAIPGVAGRFIRAPLRFLLAADEFSKALFGTMQVHAEAYRIAQAENLKGDALARRVAQLATPQHEAIGAILDKVTPAKGLVESIAKRIAARRGGDVAAMVRDKGSMAWTMAREKTAFEQITREGWNADAWTAAVAKARELAFQEDLGPLGQGIVKLRNDVMGLRYFMPFVQTIANIFRIGLRKSPLGSAPLLYRVIRSGFVRMNWSGKEWSYTKTEFVQHSAEQLLAWGTLAALSALVKPPPDDDFPFITGTMPYKGTKRGERDLAYRTAPPQSIRIGSTWYSYGRIEPFATQIAATVDLLTASSKSREGRDLTANIGSAYEHLIGQLKDKTFARGISDVLNAIQDGSSAIEWAGNFATSWVPNIVRASGRETDDKLREQRTWGQGTAWANQFGSRMAYKALPVEGMAPPAKVDLWGREITKDKGMSPTTDWLWRIFTPARGETLSHIASMDRLITNWNNQHPNDVFAPELPAPMWQIKQGDGKTKSVFMTDGQFNRFLKLAGRTALARLDAEGFDIAHPTEANIDTIAKTIANARKEARARVWQERTAKLLAPVSVGRQ